MEKTITIPQMNEIYELSTDLSRDTAKALSVLKTIWNDVFSNYEDLGIGDIDTDNKDRHNELLNYIMRYEDLRTKIDIIWDYLRSLEESAKKSVVLSDVLNGIATQGVA